MFGLAPADFKEEAPNAEQAAVDWLPGVRRYSTESVDEPVLVYL